MNSNKNILRYPLLIVFVGAIICSCSSSKPFSSRSAEPGIPAIRFLDEFVIPHNLLYDGTLVGGLSGIDYDSIRDRYFLISDDRSFTGPARFYTAKISLKAFKIDTVFFTSVSQMTQPDGTVFPSFKQDAKKTPDPESIRYHPINNSLIWTSEGDRELRAGKMNCRDPYIYEMDLTGRFMDSFFVPKNFKTSEFEIGPRGNAVFEGSTFSLDYASYFVCMEGPLYEDGPMPAFDYKGAPVRIIKFDSKTKKPVAQFAYLSDGVAHAPNPSNGFYINGVDEIVSIGKNKFLVVERSYSAGMHQNTIKIFLVDISNATDVSSLSGLNTAKNFMPATKKLLLNLDDLGRYIDNIEGITMGPALPNGNRSILMVADNNFSDLQKTQVLLFEFTQ